MSLSFCLGDEGDGGQMQWHGDLSKNRISMQIWGIAQVLHNMTFVCKSMHSQVSQSIIMFHLYFIKSHFMQLV